MQRRLTLTFPDLALIADEQEASDHQIVVDSLAGCPGVDAIEATVLEVRRGDGPDGLDLVATVLVDPQDYLRQCLQLGVDPYEVLAELALQLPKAEVEALVLWLQSEPDLTVAVLNTEGGVLDVDQWPLKPAL